MATNNDEFLARMQRELTKLPSVEEQSQVLLNRPEFEGLRRQDQQRQAFVENFTENVIKKREVEFAAEKKQQELTDAHNAKSLAGRMGMKSNDLFFAPVNLGAAAISSAGRLIGNTGSMIMETAAQAVAQPTEAEIAAYQRVQNGQGTPEDNALLDSPRLSHSNPDGSPLTAEQRAFGLGESVIPRQIIEQAQEFRNQGQRSVEAFDASGLINIDNRNELMNDVSTIMKSNAAGGLTEDNLQRAVKGDVTAIAEMAGSLLDTLPQAVNTLVENPMAIAEFLMENSVDLGLGIATGGSSLALTNSAYAASTFQKGMSNYAAENNGALPSKEQQSQMMIDAVNLALAETAGELVGIGAAKAVGPLLKSINNSGYDVFRHIGRGVSAFASEAATEGFQTYTEGKITGEDVSVEDIYAAMIIGGGVGGMMATPGVVIGSTGAVANGISDWMRKEDQLASLDVSKPEVKKAVAQAQKTGDVSALLDPTSKSYAPANAIALLRVQATDADITPEQRQELFAQASEIQNAVNVTTQNIKEAANGSELKAYQDVLNSQIAIRDSNAEGTPEHTEALSVIQEVQQYITDLQAESSDPEVVAAKIKRSEDLQKSIEVELDKFRRDLVKDVKPEEVAAQVAASTTPEEGSAGVRSMISAGMASPTKIDPDLFEELANNTSAPITDVERTALRNMAASRRATVAARDMKGVAKEVFEGSAKTLGLRQYRSRVAAAIENSDYQAANKFLGFLDNFNIGHNSKLETMKAAWAQGKGTQVAPKPETGLWEILDSKVSSAKLKSLKGLEMNSPVLIKWVEAEAKAIAATNAELNSLVEVSKQELRKNLEETFGQPINTPTQDTPAQSPEAEPVVEDTTGENTDGTDVSQEGEGSNELDGESDGQSESTPTRTEEEVVPAEETVRVEEPGRDNPVLETTESDASLEQEYVEETAAPMVKLKTLENKADDNLVAKFFDQNRGSSDPKQGKLLGNIDNVFDQITQGNLDVLANADIEQLNDRQIAALNDFKEFLSGAAESINSSFRPKPIHEKHGRKFFYEDLVQFFAEGSTLDPTVVTAMAYGAYSWVVNSARGTLFNQDDAIAKMLHFNPNQEQYPSSNALRFFRDKGVREDSLAGDIGKSIAQALGLRAKPTAPINAQAQLELALGSYGLKMLYEMGAVERINIPLSVYNNYVNSEVRLNKDEVNPKAMVAFTRVVTARNNNMVPVDNITNVIEANRNTDLLLDKIFLGENPKTFPTFKPRKLKKNTLKNGQAIPKMLRRIINRQNTKPNKLRKEAIDAFNAFSPEVQLQLMGGIIPNEATMTGPTYQQALAVADGLRRQVENLQEFTEMVKGQPKGYDTEYYLSHAIWPNQRVGIESARFNPQTSKLHRRMSMMPGWKSNILLANQKAMDSFKLRVMESFGVKTDKSLNADNLANFESMIMNDLVIQEAVTAMASIEEGKVLTESEQKAVLKAVQLGGEEMHTFDALIALASYKAALDGNKKGFAATLMSEVDGVTNGPMLAHILLGAATNGRDLLNFLNRGGIFAVNSNVKNYNVWRSQDGSEDLYESMAGKMTRKLSHDIKTGVVKPSELEAVYYFTGRLSDDNGKVTSKGRNFVKTATAAVSFGSGVETSVDNTFNKFIDSILSTIDSNMADTNEESTNKTFNDIARHLKTLGINTNDMDLRVGFTPKQIGTLKNVFNNTLGGALEAAVEEQFDDFIKRRNTLNAVANHNYDLYNIAYEDLVSSVRAAKAKALGVEVRDLTEDLTKEEKAEIEAKLQPLAGNIHTVMSLRSDNDNSKAGVNPAGKTRKLADNKSKLYNTSTRFKNETPTVEVKPDGRKVPVKGSTAVNATGMEVVNQSPGVRAVSATTHSFDSSISHSALEHRNVLNIHDAHGTGIHDMTNTAQSLNKATWDNIILYNPLNEAITSFNETVNGLIGLIQAGDISPKAMGQINTILNGNPKLRNTLTLDKVNDINDASIYAAEVRKELFENIGYIDQYALEGGQYNVSQSDRDKALNDPAQTPVTVDTDALIKLNDYVGKTKKTSLTTKPNINVDPEVNAERKTAPKTPDASKVTSWGELGTPIGKPHMDINNFLQANPNTTVKGLYNVLRKALVADNNAFHQLTTVLLDAIVQAAPDVEVIYVTPGTPMSPDVDKSFAAGTFMGWFTISSNATGNTRKVYIRGDAFKHSGIDPTLMLHELIHAATMQTINIERSKRNKNPKYKSEILKIIDVLESDLEAVRSHLKSTGNTKFDYAVSNLDEYLAHGMSDINFQRVLYTVSRPAVNINNRLITAAANLLKSVIAVLTSNKNIFKSKKAALENALGRVVYYGSAIIAENTNTLNAQYGINVSAGSIGNDFGQRENDVSNYTVEQVYDELVTNPDEQSQFPMDVSETKRLRDVVSALNEKMFGPYGAIKQALRDTTAATPLDAWIKSLDKGYSQYAASIYNSPFVMSHAQNFTAEQIYMAVNALASTGSNTVTTAYKELEAMYQHYSRNLKASDFHKGDWNTASQDEKDIATAKYDFIFNDVKFATNSNRSDYLARFVSMAMVSPELRELMNTTPPRKKDSNHSEGIFGKVEDLYDDMMEKFSGFITKAYYDSADNERVDTLLNNLLDHEARNKAVIEKRKNANDWEERANAWATSGTERAKNTVDKVLGSKAFTDHANVFVRATAQLGRVLSSEERTARFMEVLKQYRDATFTGRQGVIGGLFTELTGHNEKFVGLLRMTKRNETNRKKIIEHTGQALMDAYKDADNLSNDSKIALTKVLVDTAAHKLLDNRSMSDIANLVRNRQARLKEITSLVSQLKGTPAQVEYFQKQALALGIFKATGNVRIPHLNMNEYAIARMFGTNNITSVKSADAKTNEAIVAQMISLYAIDNTKSADRVFAGNIFNTENNRSDGNGVEFTLRMQKSLEAESLATLFNGNKAQMMFGYVPEIFNPNVSLAYGEAADINEMKLSGYTVVGEMPLDPHDTTGKQKVLLSLNGVGLAPYLSAAISLTSKSARGTELEVGNGSRKAFQRMRSDSTKAASHLAGGGLDLNTITKSKTQYAIPIYNEQGVITGYRHIMRNNVKDSVLGRDHRLDKVMGKLAGNIVDKQVSAEQNNTIIDALYEDYKADYAVNPNAYVEIGPDSSDKRLREMWNMLPQETKNAAIKKFGGEHLYMKAELETITFGYRQSSIADSFDKLPEERNAMEKVFTNLFETMYKHWAKGKLGLNDSQAEYYAARVGNHIRKFERGWQEVVKEMKDIIVVKSGVVLAGNIWSNLTLLKIYGVPLKDIAKNHNVATKGLFDYQADEKRLNHLVAMQASGYFTGTSEYEVNREIAEIESRMAVNPVRTLIEAGLMPTIVEDVSNEDDPYSYKSYWSNKIGEKTQWVPQGVKAAANQVYIGHDTALYKSLNKTTQYSDFVARYTLYEHLISRKTNPLSHEDAVTEVADAFVNYDIPMPRTVQYMDDMGIIMFTKYTLRIQRVIFKLMRERPASIATTVLINQFIDLGAYFMDGSILNKVGNNPFGLSALNYPGTLDELATVQAAEEALSLMK